MGHLQFLFSLCKPICGFIVSTKVINRRVLLYNLSKFVALILSFKRTVVCRRQLVRKQCKYKKRIHTSCTNQTHAHGVFEVGFIFIFNDPIKPIVKIN